MLGAFINFDQLINWLIDRLNDWLGEWLIDWLIDGLIDGLIDWFCSLLIGVIYSVRVALIFNTNLHTGKEQKTLNKGLNWTER